MSTRGATVNMDRDKLAKAIEVKAAECDPRSGRAGNPATQSA